MQEAHHCEGRLMHGANSKVYILLHWRSILGLWEWARALLQLQCFDMPLQKFMLLQSKNSDFCAHRGALHFGGGLLGNLAHKAYQAAVQIQRHIVPGRHVLACRKATWQLYSRLTRKESLLETHKEGKCSRECAQG